MDSVCTSERSNYILVDCVFFFGNDLVSIFDIPLKSDQACKFMEICKTDNNLFSQS